MGKQGIYIPLVDALQIESYYRRENNARGCFIHGPPSLDSYFICELHELISVVVFLPMCLSMILINGQTTSMQ